LILAQRQSAADKLDEERLSMRMRERRASYPDCRATGRARMVGVFVASGGRDTSIYATESDEAYTVGRQFVRIVPGKKW
jgi:hypothetical protein